MARRVGSVRLVRISEAFERTAEEIAARMSAQATNTVLACSTCGERTREPGHEDCLGCFLRCNRRMLREAAGEISGISYDDERIGK